MTRLLVYGGWYGSGNIGDDAILIGLRNLFTEVISDIEIAALSIDVSQTKRVCGVEAFPIKSPRELLFSPPGHGLMAYQRIFRWADACILTGGTPIYDYDHVSRMIHCGLPRLIGKKLVCFGIGVKPIRSFHGRRLVRWLMGNAEAVSTRDRDSQSELRDIGFEGEIRITGDSALLLKPESEEPATLREAKRVPEDYLVAFCPRAISSRHRPHYHAPLTHETISKMRRNIAGLADLVSTAGHDIVFLPMHQAPGDNDVAEIAKIRDMMVEPSTLLSPPSSPETAMRLLGETKLVFGLRLHSLILAAMAGTPIVSMDYDPKIRGFMEHAGVGDYIYGVEDSAEDAMRGIEEALDNSRPLRRTLRGNCENMRARIREEGKLVGEIITRDP